MVMGSLNFTVETVYGFKGRHVPKLRSQRYKMTRQTGT